ncbi:hypothetical protein EI555_011528, partial [Monodon monoceros]
YVVAWCGRLRLPQAPLLLLLPACFGLSQKPHLLTSSSRGIGKSWMCQRLWPRPANQPLPGRLPPRPLSLAPSSLPCSQDGGMAAQGAPRFLLTFDFDETIVDENSDDSIEAQKAEPSSFCARVVPWETATEVRLHLQQVLKTC